MEDLRIDDRVVADEHIHFGVHFRLINPRDGQAQKVYESDCLCYLMVELFQPQQLNKHSTIVDFILKVVRFADFIVFKWTCQEQLIIDGGLRNAICITDRNA